MIQNIMIVLWHWHPLKRKMVHWDEMPVEGDLNSSLIRINIDEENLQKSVDLTVEKILDKKSKYEEVQIIVFYHYKEFSREQSQYLKLRIKDVSKAKIISFGGGGNYLYYDPKFDTGLLDQWGDLVNNDTYEFEELKSNGVSEIVTRKASVVNKNNNNSNYTHIKKINFQQVWNYYNVECKRLIYEFKEQLFIYLLGRRIDKTTIDLRSLLKDENNLLAQKLDDICGGKINTALIEKIYPGSNKIQDAYKGVIHQIDRPLYPNYLEDLRDQFDQLLIAMPEMV